MDMMSQRVTKRFLEMSEIYKLFCFIDDGEFSKVALGRQFLSETYGKEHKFQYSEKFEGKFNGYSVGKHWMDVTIAMWREDIALGNLTKAEIFLDEKYPVWWLSMVFGNTETNIEEIRREAK